MDIQSIPIKTSRLIFGHNLCECTPNFQKKILWFQRKLPMYLSQKFHLILTTLLHNLAKFEIQNIQFTQWLTSSFLPQMHIESISAKCVCCSNCIFGMSCQLQCRHAVSCTTPWLQHQSISHQDHPTSPKLPQLFHVLDLVLVNAVLQSSSYHRDDRDC